MGAYRIRHGRTLNTLGNLYKESGRLEKAEEALRDGLKTRAALAKQHPNVSRYQADLAISHLSVGNLFMETDRPQDAKKAYSEALEIQEILADQHPTVTEFAVGLGTTQVNLGDVSRAMGQADDALVRYNQAVTTLLAALKQQPQYVATRSSLRLGYWGRAQALSQLRRHTEALQDCDRAIELAEGQERDLYQVRRAATLAKRICLGHGRG
jgi:tetratricopeptide (TPR) repeat protein